MRCGLELCITAPWPGRSERERRSHQPRLSSRNLRQRGRPLLKHLQCRAEPAFRVGEISADVAHPRPVVGELVLIGEDHVAVVFDLVEVVLRDGVFDDQPAMVVVESDLFGRGGRIAHDRPGRIPLTC